MLWVVAGLLLSVVLAGLLYKEAGSGVFFDSVRWVRINQAKLPPPDRVDELFRQLQLLRLHPLAGCPFYPFCAPLLSGNATEDARYADVVTVHCVDFVLVGRSWIPTEADSSKLVETSAANAAYISIHAKSHEHRLEALAVYDAIKRMRPDMFMTLSGALYRPLQFVYQLIDGTGFYDVVGNYLPPLAVDENTNTLKASVSVIKRQIQPIKL